jgi:hypothetical protein
MNNQQLSSICQQVYHRFPGLTGCAPSVHQRPGDQVLLVFSGTGRAVNGKTLAQTVRVVADASGKIIKMTSSR